MWAIVKLTFFPLFVLGFTKKVRAGLFLFQPDRVLRRTKKADKTQTPLRSLALEPWVSSVWAGKYKFLICLSPLCPKKRDLSSMLVSFLVFFWFWIFWWMFLFLFSFLISWFLMCYAWYPFTWSMKFVIFDVFFWIFWCWLMGCIFFVLLPYWITDTVGVL